MKKIVAALLFWLFAISAGAQGFKPGEYDSGLKLAYDEATKRITGYFENYTGLDEQTGNPRFSCIFYINGIVKGNKFSISTYYPGDKQEWTIEGTLEIRNNSVVAIKLPEEHGGCWNVQHFADEPATFKLEKEKKWARISYVIREKGYFHKDKKAESKLKSYVVKDDFICIDKIEGEWAHCSYYGEKVTTGWLRLKDIY